jgi:outer membrane protein TolC
MKFFQTLIVAVGLALASDGVAGYRDLKKEIDGYQPTALARTKMDLAEPAEITGPGHGTDRWTEQIFNTARSKWTRALTLETDPQGFYRPGAEALAVLGPGTVDASKAIQALGSRFSLETLETLAILRNPSIAAAALKFRATLEAFGQIQALDEMLVTYSAFTKSLMVGIGPMKGRDPIAMKFPFPGISALKGKIADQTVRIAYESLQIARRKTITTVRKTFWELLYVKNARTVTRETLDLLQHLEGVAMTRYRTGKTSYQDVVKVRISRETFHEELLTLKRRQHTIESKLLATLDLPGQPVFDPAREKGPSRGIPFVDDLVAAALAERQELKRLQARIHKMEFMIEMAETMILPPLTLNLSLYTDEPALTAGSGSSRSGFATVIPAATGAGLPRKPLFGASDAYLREIREKLRALKNTWLAERADTRFRTRQAWFTLDRAVREERLFRDTIVKLSQTALNVSTKGYESGDVLFADLFVSFRQWFDARLMTARKRSDVGIARAELVNVLGIDPDHPNNPSKNGSAKGVLK